MDEVLAELLPIANSLLSTSARTWDELVDAILPLRLGLLKQLAVLYEKQMLACRDAKAYFPACVMGAAMLEAFLILLCMLNPEGVKKTDCYKGRIGKRTADFERTICNLGFEELVEISAELNWVPASLISADWKAALPEAFIEIVKERRPNMSRDERTRRSESLVINPAYSLMLLLNMMRNRIHPGRWVRERHVLKDENAFGEWAQVALVGAAHIRDCLLTHSQQDLIEMTKRAMQARIIEVANPNKTTKK
jgi:hypothetical protein